MEEPKTTCVRCGATILERTARKHEGLCRPCVLARGIEEIGTTAFGRSFDRDFVRPSLRTAEGQSCWISSSFRMAGPLWATREGGSVDYLFRRETLPGVTNLATLEAWLHGEIDHLCECAQQLRNGSADERSDGDVLLQKAEELRQLLRDWAAFAAGVGNPAS